MKEPTVEEKEYYSLNKKAWDLLAPLYNFMVLPISRMRDRVVAFTDARQGSRILDLATGTGKQAFAFAKRGYNVTGIDISEAMLRIARRNNKFGVNFEAADATDLTFESNSFDVTCISFALHEMPLTIRQKVLSEMARVTKPQGTILIVDYGLPENRFGRFLFYHLVKLFEGKRYAEFIHSELEGLLRQCGIEIREKLPLLLGAARVLKGSRS